MSPRELGTQIAKIGVTLLVLWAPNALWAQSGDAAPPVAAHQHIAASACSDAVSESAPSLFEFCNGAISPAQLSANLQWLVYPSDSVAGISGWSLAFNASADDPASGQQSLPPQKRQQLPPGYSVASAYRHSVPGDGPILQGGCLLNACSHAQEIMCCAPATTPFAHYLQSPDAVNLTARDNLNSAVKNIIDPFNLLTIGADAAIGIASDSHSVYGPGATGIAKYAGVSLTEDMTGEFFGTFLVPSLVHQDPHYHREPYMPIRHRILHAITQVVWAKSYTGQPMFNYGNIVGGIATAVVSNTFVPGPGRQGFSATAQRLAIAFAISPSGNLIEEFVPDIAHRINLRVVIFQRILNTVSLEESGVP